MTKMTIGSQAKRIIVRGKLVTRGKAKRADFAPLDARQSWPPSVKARSPLAGRPGERATGGNFTGRHGIGSESFLQTEKEWTREIFFAACAGFARGHIGQIRAPRFARDGKGAKFSLLYQRKNN